MCHSGSGRVVNREAVLGLPASTASIQADHFCCSRTFTTGGVHLLSHINQEKTDGFNTAAPCHSSVALTLPISHTKTVSYATQTNNTGSQYAQIQGPSTLKGYLLRTPGTSTFCTRLVNATINLQHHSVRLCHSKTSSKNPNLKLTQSGKSASNTFSRHLDDQTEAQLTHTDPQGRAAMVDVGGKLPTRRAATARATVILGPVAFRLLQDNQLAKGDALAVAQLAGIMASKQTSALIPLCHPLPLDHTAVSLDLDELQDAVVITATCRTTGKTGVEMEALTAASVAALTVYDMCKAVSHDIIISDIKLVSKTGGKKDFNRHHPWALPPSVNPNFFILRGIILHDNIIIILHNIIYIWKYMSSEELWNIW